MRIKEQSAGAKAVGRTYESDDLEVTLSAPVQVAKRKNLKLIDVSEDEEGQFLWYPQIARLADGGLLAQIRLGGDSWQADLGCPIGFSWSCDGGRNWSELMVAGRHNGYASLILPSGDLLILTYLPMLSERGMTGSCNLIPKGRREVLFVEDAVEITGFQGKAVMDPSMDALWEKRERKTRLGGFALDGRPVRVPGGWLTTLYGKYEGHLERKCTLHTAFSADGYKWAIRSTIVGPDSPLGQHPWGNSEAEICRLPGGRLMCLYRLDNEPYGRSYSSDEGFTWTRPDSLPPGVGTVEPRLAVTQNGVVALFGGRPRLYLWLNSDGTGNGWEAIDLFTHHNALACPGQVRFGGYRFDGSSAYGSVVALEGSSVLFIYDCFTDDEFGIYTVRADIRRKR